MSKKNRPAADVSHAFNDRVTKLEKQLGELYAKRARQPHLREYGWWWCACGRRYISMTGTVKTLDEESRGQCIDCEAAGRRADLGRLAADLGAA